MTQFILQNQADLIIGFAAFAVFFFAMAIVTRRTTAPATTERATDDVEATKFDPTVFATFTGIFFAARLEEAFFAEADRIGNARLRAAEMA